MERPKLNLDINKSVDVELLYDNPVSGSSQYGQYYLYSVRSDNREYSFFAPAELHHQMKSYKRGDIIQITRLGAKRGNKIVSTYAVSAAQQNGNHVDEEEPQIKRNSVTRDLFTIMLESLRDAYQIQKELEDVPVDINKIGISMFISRMQNK
jgi:hypothetical protein